MTLEGICAATYDGLVYYSADGATWAGYGSTESNVTAIAMLGDRVFVTCGNDDNVYSTPDGITWASVHQVLGGVGILKGSSLAVFKGYLYAVATSFADDYSSSTFKVARTHNGTDWSTVYTFTDNGGGGSLVDYMSEGCLYAGGGYIHAVISGACWYPDPPRTGASQNYNVYEIHSSLNGTSWSKTANVACIDNDNYDYDNIFTLAYAGGKYIIASDRDIWYGSQADFETGFAALTRVSTGYLSITSLSLNCGDWTYYDDGGQWGGMATFGAFRYHLCSPALLRSPVDSDSWSACYTGYLTQMCQFESNIYGATTGIVVSTDNGESFDLIDDARINGKSFAAICMNKIMPATSYVTMF